MARPVRVVVADDQAAFRRAARSVLAASEEFELAYEAASGEEAVAAISEDEADLVLMDVHMDGIGGLEATRRIVEASSDVSVILVSSDRAEHLAAEATASGALAFLPKDELDAETLRELWSRRARSPAPRGRRAPPSHAG